MAAVSLRAEADAQGRVVRGKPRSPTGPKLYCQPTDRRLHRVSLIVSGFQKEAWQGIHGVV